VCQREQKQRSVPGKFKEKPLMLFAASHSLLLFSVYPCLYKSISEAQALGGNQGMRHVRLTGTSSSCWGGENPLKSSCKGGGSRSRYTKESQPRNGDKSILRRKKQPETTATRLPNGTEFLSLSLSLSLAHTAWSMKPLAEGDMHKR
jgi:hypothetical protein